MDFDVSIASDFDRQCVTAVLPSLERLRDDIRKDMRFHIHNETGHLASTVFCDLDQNTGTITGGATADYAAAHEFGHSTSADHFVPGEPFVRPSFMRKRGEI
jgi:phage gpG-like protein